MVKAEILVSEISWMGNSSSANAEWIELQNTGGSSVNLSGWTLKSEDGSPSINLSGSISGGSYALLERTSDATVSGVTALLTYSGALANDGEHLVLRDGNGNIIQNLDFSSGWPAGDNSTKQTMQWNGSIWITAEPTPGEQNASFDSGNAGNQGTDTGSDEDAESEDDDDSEESNSSSSSSANNSPLYTKEIVEIKVVDSSVPVGSPVKFSLHTRDLNGANILRGDFMWNMGDGTERFYSKNEKFEHTYDYEGTYVVYLKYYSTYFEGMEPDATSKITITVSSPNVSITKIHSDGSVEIKNISSQEIDLSGWILKDSNGAKFVIPEGTYILGNKNLVLNSKRVRLNP
ncbi:MAG: lamin tail domain-containing protein [Candidatus Paceibacterota bacterium]